MMISLYENTVILGLCGAILFVIALGYRYVTKPYAAFPTWSTISFSIKLYLLGKCPQSTSIAGVFLQEAINQAKRYRSEGLFLMWVPSPCLVIFSEKASKTFLSEGGIDKPAKYEVAHDLLGRGLILSNGETWKKQRKMLNPVFHTGMLKGKISIFNECADALVKELSEVTNKSCLDIYEYLKIVSISVLCESILGMDMKNEQMKETMKNMAHIVTKMAGISTYRVIFPWWRSDFIFSLTSEGKELKKLRDDWNNIIRKVILGLIESTASSQTAKGESTNSIDNQKSLFHILFDYSCKNPSFTLQDIEEQMKSFVVAGYDTASISMMWCLYLLGLHPDIQEQAYNEVKSMTDEFVTFEQLCELKYLERIIMETMRLYPTIPAIARELSRDVQFEKYKVPKGTDVVFFVYGLHRNPEIYPDPEKFDPDRFEGNLKRPFAYLPFSEGSRICIGKKFAMMEMKVILAHVIRNFQITSLNKREDLQFHWQISLMPTKPILLTLTPRQHLY